MDGAFVFIFFCSISFQLAATFLALRLIRITGRKWGWLLISIAVLLMTVRRVESLMNFVGGASPNESDFLFEMTGFVLSVLMFLGMWRISPIFKELAESRENLRSANDTLNVLARQQRILLDYSSDFIFRHDPKGNITYASPAVERITGYSTEEWCDHYTKFYTENPLNRFGREATEELNGAGKNEVSYRVEVRHKSGDGVWLEVNKQVYREDGRIVEVIGVARDITKRVFLEVEREKLVTELREAIANIKTLKGMLPICASCKKIRDDRGYWNQIESYIREHTNTEFTHSICPDCVRTLYQEYQSNSGKDVF